MRVRLTHCRKPPLKSEHSTERPQQAAHPEEGVQHAGWSSTWTGPQAVQGVPRGGGAESLLSPGLKEASSLATAWRTNSQRADARTRGAWGLAGTFHPGLAARTLACLTSQMPGSSESRDVIPPSQRSKLRPEEAEWYVRSHVSLQPLRLQSPGQRHARTPAPRAPLLCSRAALQPCRAEGTGSPGKSYF